MPKLPTDGIAAARFLVRHLYRPIDVTADSHFFAVAETADPGDDNWFWNDDNAKVLELMSRPEVWREFPEETREILRFVRSMCHGPFVFRRVASPRIDEIGTDGGITTYRHSLMRVRCDLPRGAVVAGVRFHDERSFDNLMLHGNYVEFTYRLRRYKLPVPGEGCDVRSELDGQKLTLRHTAELHFAAGWQRRRLGTISYTYRFDAASMLFAVEAALDLAPGIVVRDVVLTIGHGGLGYCFFDNVVANAGAGGRKLFSAGVPAVRLVDAADVSYYAIRQGHISGDALAVHSVPARGQAPAGFEFGVAIQGRLDRVVARYAFPGSQQGRLTAAEHKLITAGGFYDRVADYADFMRQASAANGHQAAAYDYSISYDYGVTLNAFAKCSAVAAKEPSLLAPSSPAELRELFDQLLGHYFALYVDRHEQQPNAIFSRELAFVALAVTTMYRTTREDAYRQHLARLCDLLLEFEFRLDNGDGAPVSAFLMRKDNPKPDYLDCQAAALLALTAAAPLLADERLPPTIERGLRALDLAAGAIDLGGDGKLDSIGILPQAGAVVGYTETALWNFKAGLAARFYTALRNSPDTRLQSIASRHAKQIGLCEGTLRHQLARSIVDHDGCIEICTSVLSGATNSETQPWAMLGLLDHPCD